MEKVLRLGRTDEDVRFTQEEKAAFLELYHHPHGFVDGEIRFRDDCRNCWYAWENLPGRRVRDLTQFLQAAGFMPYASHDGIYGYVTQAAVRLFQEYVRTIADPERHARRSPPSWPDGVVGMDTRTYIADWQQSGRTCRWADGEESPDYDRWLRWLTATTTYYRNQPTVAMQKLQATGVRGDSLPPDDWSFDPRETHLIGIRRGVGTATSAESRALDDLFVLLLNGKCFYFWGSTDANPRPGTEGYLCEGQHRYRLDWHNIGTAKRERIYKAARPAGAGVMVIRDVHGHNALTEANRRDGFDPRPNPTFNIHWSGLGISNWSAGCQVVSGKNYVNDAGGIVSCTEYAARTDRQRGERRTPEGPRLTMGAYIVLSDLVLCYTLRPDLREKPTFLYTLIEAETFDRVPGIAGTDIDARLAGLRNEGFY
ncbi:hypothetical protein CLV84_4024 [Neolewinella xylanilytica]|uniref:Peptidoglycan binding protein n=1 Tax=Neolewinella xylanilytica TaxID=1514080 RepID=A0A2S6I0G8_9BACT|nr:peptidoglycan-binding protein [Neolewinella xylanilytica]PPK84255.1 hypothetical protein CLV84_4024 [Neolewinella xylanilytica]